MIITHKFDMAVDRCGPAPLVDAVQGEKNVRTVVISLYTTPAPNEKEPWPVPDGISAMVRFRKHDGTGGVYDTLPDGTTAITIADNTVSVVLAPQVLTVPGPAKAQVELSSGEQTMATFAFNIRVEADPSVGAMDSKDYVYLSAYVSKEVQRILEEGGIAEEVVISSEEPTDESVKIWINPDEEEEEESSSSLLAVTVTDSGDGITADKTNAEIYDAYNNGWQVILKYGASVYHLQVCNSAVAMFAMSNYPTANMIRIANNVCTITPHTLVTNDTFGNQLKGYMLVVTITDNGDGTYTSSHTRAEIAACVDNGGTAVLKDSTGVYELVSVTPVMARFGQITVTASTTDAYYYIVKDSTVTKQTFGQIAVNPTATVGQTIIVEEVDSDGKPTKWKAVDYQPRTHWNEETIFLEETTMEISSDGTELSVTKPLVVGATYKVIWNGVEYQCVAADNDGTVMIGNLEFAFGTGDTGEPFLIGIADNGDGTYFAMALSLKGTMSVTLSITEVKFAPIPVKYVTNALPYYIDVTVEGTSNPYTHNCYNKVAEVEAALRSDRDVIVRMSYGTINWRLTLFGYLTISENGKTLCFGHPTTISVLGTVMSQIYLNPQADGTYTVTTEYSGD